MLFYKSSNEGWKLMVFNDFDANAEREREGEVTLYGMGIGSADPLLSGALSLY